MAQPLFALIDCNNFFVSCERIFRPDLEGKPVVVLSSNDGCAIARSQEAKTLGIPMAAPAFKYKQLFRQHGVVQFSANFELYGDISRRITEILTTVTPRLEVYSIDESFLDISQLDIADYELWGRQLKRQLQRWTGVPVSIGIASTKTLAKLASERAKKTRSMQGVVYLQENERVQHLKAVSVEELWGVGLRMGPRLRALGISSAEDLANLNLTQARQAFGSIHGERMVRELRGQSCAALEPIASDQKSIAATRTFGEDTNAPHVIEAAIANFGARAAYRLRSGELAAKKVGVFATTNRHKEGYKKQSAETVFREPTADSGMIISAAVRLFNSFYQPGLLYHRAGVSLLGLSSQDIRQINLLDNRHAEALSRDQNRMKTVDSLNARYGQAAVHYAAEDLAKSWKPKKQLVSPSYTTIWKELPKISIAS